MEARLRQFFGLADAVPDSGYGRLEIYVRRARPGSDQTSAHEGRSR